MVIQFELKKLEAISSQGLLIITGKLLTTLSFIARLKMEVDMFIMGLSISVKLEMGNPQVISALVQNLRDIQGVNNYIFIGELNVFQENLNIFK